MADISASLGRVYGGFIATAAIGIGLGLAIGRSRLAKDVLLPPF
jgi:NitT/TauT family transport system permease protein